jgi:hypothetical protein
MSGNTCGCHNWRGGVGVLLAFCGLRPINILSCTGQPLNLPQMSLLPR